MPDKKYNLSQRNQQTIHTSAVQSYCRRYLFYGDSVPEIVRPLILSASLIYQNLSVDHR